METIGFVLLKWGTGHLDSLLFFIPLALLLVLWASDHIIRFFKRQISDFRTLYCAFKDEDDFISEDLMISLPRVY